LLDVDKTRVATPPAGREGLSAARAPALPAAGCGCREPCPSCDLQVFVDESAEAVASEVANVRVIGWRSGSSCRWLLIEGSVRPVAVVKSVRGAVPVFRPARFSDRFPNPPGGFHRNGLSVSPRWVCW
jgi:hypothetical protein